MPGDPSELERALARGQRPGQDLAEELLTLGSYTVSSAEEARAIVAALQRVDLPPDALPCGMDPPAPGGLQDCPTTPLYMLTSLFQRVGDRDAYEVLFAEGMPLLLQMYDGRLGASTRNQDDLLFLLKVFAMYRLEEGLERIVSALQRGLWSQDSLWETVFQQFDQEHPLRHELCDRLRDPLPRGFAAVAYLDFANTFALEGQLLEHPFDTAAGIALLEGWLTDSSARRYSYAHSATACLPFVSRPGRDRLLALALDHSATRVQLEAAWASAMVGSAGGIKLLQRHCLDPRTSGVARAYLAELEREDAVPPEALEPDLLAQAEMCLWLAHPGEYGRPPDAIRVYDHRTIRWPPTHDERQVWLLEYRYEPGEPGHAEPEIGIGMVGSVTFALVGEATANLPPEDVYALHCCWELEVNEDPRAPAERSVEAGRRLLSGEG